MDKKFSDFSKNMEVRIGEDQNITVYPSVYYHSLNEGFRNYFKITQRHKDTYHFALDITSRSLSFIDTEYTVGIILGFHRFFELLIKDLLQRVNPFLAVKTFENEGQVVNYFCHQLDAETLKSIEFGEAFKRFKKIVALIDEGKLSNNLIEKFRFLSESTSESALESLAMWRNRIAHNGKTLPYMYYLDYIVSQEIIPLISKILKADFDTLKGFSPPYFMTPTGINLLDRFLEVKFDIKDFEDVADESAKRKVGTALLELAHLKELGRAAYTFHLNFINDKAYLEPYYDNVIEKYIRFADAESISPHFMYKKKCPCCGHPTLVVYQREFVDIFSQSRKELAYIYWFNCTVCTYSLKNNLPDPFHFGIGDELLFPVTQSR